MDMPVTVQGTLRPDGTLELAQKVTLPPGQVTVTIQPAGAAAPAGRGLADVIDEIRKGQEARGFQGRGADEIEAARQEEVLEGLGLFLLWQSGRRKIEYPPGRDPPVAIAIEIDIAASVHSNAAEHAGGIREQGNLTPPIDLGQQSRRKREFIAAPR